MSYIVVGINHKSAPIDLREKLSLDQENSTKTLKKIVASPSINEAVILSTCNRTELYSATLSPDKAIDTLSITLLKPLQNHNLQDIDIKNLVYCKTNKDAIKHLFHVASSLDSQILGENQITNQVKTAYKLALNQNASGTKLNKLFERALFVSKRVKTETNISKGNASLGSAAVVLAKRIFGSLNRCQIALVGLGEIGRQVLKTLNAQSPEKTWILTRTYEKAKKLESQGFGKAAFLSQANKTFVKTDIIITALSKTIDEFSVTNFKDIMQKRAHRPLFIIDLGLPRNVPANVANIENIYLYNLDDLNDISKEAKKLRQHTLLNAKNIIDEEVSLFYENCLNEKAIPAISGLAKKLEDIRSQELKKSLSKLSHLKQNEIDSIEKLTKSIIDKILQEPILALKQNKDMAHTKNLTLFKKIFRLDEETDNKNKN